MASNKTSEGTHHPGQNLFRFSISSLPYLYYFSLAGAFVVLVALIKRFRRSALDPLTRNGLLIVSSLLILSCAAAHNKGEAFLQLIHFLPFFLIFAFLPYLLKGAEKLEQIALLLIISTIPINILSFCEYILKSIHFPRSMRKTAIVSWVRATPDKGRAIVMFDHPNALASYLVIVLGLGLGLILKRSYEKSAPEKSAPEKGVVPAAAGVDGAAAPQVHGAPWQVHRQSYPNGLIYFATYLNLVGIFSTGSRNGFLVVISQLVVFTLCVKARRVILLMGVTSLAVIVAGAAVFGIGGRALSVNRWTDDPRVAVWQLALNLIHDRPWLGWGLGNFKLLYPPYKISGYAEVYHPHNFWLLLGCETGILVTIALTVWVGYICLRTVRRLMLDNIEPGYRSLLLGYCLAFWGCIAFALFDVTYYDARINLLNWTILAAVYAGGNSRAADAP